MDASSPISSSNFETLIELLRSRAGYGSRVAFTFLADGEAESAHLTYAELEKRALAIGAFLQSQGASGERALLFLSSWTRFPRCLLGLPCSRVSSACQFFLRASRAISPALSAIVADSQAKLVLTTSRIASRSEELCKRAPDLASLQWLATDSVSPDLAAEWARPVSKFSNAGVSPVHFRLHRHSARSHGVPTATCCITPPRFSAFFGFTPDSLGLTWLPHYHDMGLIGGLLQPIYAGCSSIVMPPASFLQRPIRWLDAVSR